ncbi:TPA: conjugative transfer signal peptidase TraF [Legionella pneumophila]|nr:conjugative transfer signal peptidase TraF [Legionella pneumophila]HBB6898825.1 conjugative transfer signal peptidase TraF [Legionella pneumophila]HBI2947146.1 conjugative transfer signal peptidase TraF [Legionella pneumophila]
MKKLSAIISTLLISLIVVGALFHAMGFRINLTESIPIGLYRITSEASIKNTYVIFCPDNRESFRLARDRGYIDHSLYCDGYGYLMKKVVAVSGDILSVTNKGVFVNQILTPYSKPKLQDGMKRSLPQWQVMDYQLQNDEVMTMTSQSEWSFDGRYYGLVHTGQIKGMITPIWVINKRREPHES